MYVYRTLLIGAVAVALVGCNPFYRSPAVEVSASDENLNTRWHGTLASPASLAGVVQMSGTATMVPGTDARTTRVSLDLVNAAPGGVHPWGLHRGQCDYDEGLVGQRSSYRNVMVDRDGRASTRADVELHTPTSGRYSVRVTASAANSDLVVACANLAPPSR
jgi:hypothetical protein